MKVSCISIIQKQIFINIVSNFVPHETVICDNREPPWRNTRIKKLTIKKYCIKNIFVAAKTEVFEKFKLLQIQNKIVNLTNDSRDRYYTRISNKLNDPAYPLKHTGKF